MNLLKRILNKLKLNKTECSLFLHTYFHIYLAMLCTLVFLGLVSYFILINVSGKDRQKADNDTTARIRTLCDEILESVDASAREMLNDIYVNSVIFSNSSTIKDPYSSYSMKKVSEVMGKSKKLNQAIEDMYIFLRRPNSIITEEDIYQSTKYFYEKVPYYQWSYNDFVQIMMSREKQKYMPVAIRENDKVIREPLLYIKTLPLSEKMDSRGSLIIHLNKQVFETVIKYNRTKKQDVTFILDSSNRLVFAQGNHPGSEVLGYDGLTAENGEIQIKYLGKNYRVLYDTSRVNGWKYIYMTPADALAIRYLAIGLIILLSVLLCGASGLYFAVVCAKGKLKPVLQFAHQLDTSGENALIMEDGINLVVKSAQKTLQDNHKLRNMIQKQQAVMQTVFLTQLLKGDLGKRNSVLAQASELNLDLNYNTFYVMNISIEDDPDENTNHEMEAIHSLVARMVESIACQLLGKVFTIHQGECLSVLVCSMEMQQQPLLNKEVRSVLKFLADAVRVKLHSAVSIGVGGQCRNVADIDISYKESLKALEYKYIYGQETIVIYNEVVHTREKFNYPVEVEVELMGCIKKGDKEGAKRIFYQVVLQDGVLQRMSPDNARLFLNKILGTVLRVLEEMGRDVETIFGPEFDPVGKLTRCIYAGDAADLLQMIIQRICVYTKSMQKSSNVLLKESILQYVDKNYLDQNLCLNVLAEQFNLNSSYLSFFFKEQTGVNFVDYIRHKKVNTAKALLLYDSVTLDEISRRLGYANSAVLIRNFKKETGMTPKEFKESQLLTKAQWSV